jgi:hypothetical protein
MVEEAAEIAEVPIRKARRNGRAVFQVGGKPGIDAGENGFDPGPVECKVTGAGLAVKGGKWLLEHIPAVDAEVGGIESSAVGDYLVGGHAVWGPKRFGEHPVMLERIRSDRVGKIEDHLDGEEGCYEGNLRRARAFWGFELQWFPIGWHALNLRYFAYFRSE